MSDDEAEYKQLSRLLGSGKDNLDNDKVSEALREHGITKLAKINELFLITDPSDIRKERSAAIEDLGKVRSLSGDIINGFSSLSTIAIDLHGRNLTLLETEVYSNRSKNYITEEELSLQSKPLSAQATDKERARFNLVSELLTSGDYINANKILQQQLKELSVGLKSGAPDKLLTHILDREFDSMRTLDFIDDELEDNFVVRMKISRVAEESTTWLPGKECEFFSVTPEELKKINQHADINYTIINGDICYDNVASRSNTQGKIFYCTGDITDFLKSKSYRKNSKLTRALAEIKQPGQELQGGEVLSSWYRLHTEKEVNVKLINEAFPFNTEYHYPKIMIKNKVYQDAAVDVAWGNKIGAYQVIKVQIKDKDGNGIFKQPMLLVTNKATAANEHALNIYHIYLKRAKIESVFKFLKDVLGWEECQLRQFNSIKNLLTFCYFVAGYFYEIESTLTQLPIIQHIAFLGGGKGRVTRKFILDGFGVLATKKIADDYIAENNITPAELSEMYKYAGVPI